MPDNPNDAAPGQSTGGAILSGVASALPVVGSVANALLQNHANKQARKYAEEQYAKQRNDALADWRMQNEYNSPGAQMERLKAAGLNPNLVYGNGATATSSSMPRQSSAQTWSPHAPQIDLSGVGGGIMAYYDTKIKQAQVDNLALQGELMRQEKANKIANEFKTYAQGVLAGSQRDYTDTKGQLAGVDLNYAVKLKELSMEGMRASISKTLQDTQLSAANTKYRLGENERQELKTGMTLQQGAERILLLRKQQLLIASQTENNYQKKQEIINQTIMIDRRIDWMRGQIKASDEKARMLESTPDWGDQRTIDMLQSLLGGWNQDARRWNYGSKPGGIR